MEAATTKNGHPRTIPLSNRAMNVLRRRQGRSGNASLVVFESRGVRRTLGTVNRTFRRALTRVGIENCRFHNLRHTFATRLCQDDADPYTFNGWWVPGPDDDATLRAPLHRAAAAGH
ncbi:MAG: Phage integrase family [Thermomicrobiales bacterium]|nr:Phage integrase family [Thermomicrobiales bacterium]